MALKPVQAFCFSGSRQKCVSSLSVFLYTQKGSQMFVYVNRYNSRSCCQTSQKDSNYLPFADIFKFLRSNTVSVVFKATYEIESRFKTNLYRLSSIHFNVAIFQTIKKHATNSSVDLNFDYKNDQAQSHYYLNFEFL
jgi:hypothetical protein